MRKSEAIIDNGQGVTPKEKTPAILEAFLPGTTLGILGSGQLGRMSAMAAKSLGYRVVVYDETPDGPAVSCADLAITASFGDPVALARFASEVDVVTVEFENIPVSALEFLERIKPVRPSSSVVRICQDRIMEKEFLLAAGIAVAPFRVINSALQLKEALSALGGDSILKTAVLGYDGKGQISLKEGDDATAAWERLSSPLAVLEQKIVFQSEASVICSRSTTGESLCFPVQTNVHRDGILDVSTVPANLPESVTTKAHEIATEIAEKLEVVGLITVEFFVLADGNLLVNELAPRPHNSGHHTLETTMTSQFCQHVRAVCGLPLGSVMLRSPGVMINLLGDLWKEGQPDWKLLLREAGLFLHLYGKREAKQGRKMGHYTLLGEGMPARDRAIGLRALLGRPES